jgi:hypothetical protein
VTDQELERVAVFTDDAGEVFALFEARERGEVERAEIGRL